MGSGVEPLEERDVDGPAGEPTERERAIRASTLGVILGLALALLGRRRRASR